MAHRTRWLPWLLVVMLALGSSNPAFAQSTSEPVTLYIQGIPVFAADPQAAAATDQFELVDHLFLGLVDFEPVGRQIVPRMATAWTFEEATNTWTFTLRNDVSWVRYDAATDEIVPVRPVVAADFVAGIRRGCDPTPGNLYTHMLAVTIAGCQAVAETDPDDLTPQSFEQIEARALDDTTLAITLTAPRAYFIPMSWLPILRAVPGEIVDAFGADWVRPEHILTNGPFVATEVEPDVRMVFKRNPWLPADLAGPGNLDRVIMLQQTDVTTSFLLYLDNEIDLSGSPDNMAEYLPDNPDLLAQLVLVSTSTVYEIVFDMSAPPFDDVHARRAFSAAIDRQAFVTEIIPGAGVPMMHWVPPGAFGASPIDQIGIDQGPSWGFDPDFARAELALAGYPDCQGFPEVRLDLEPGATFFGEFLQGMIQEHLGCPMEVLDIEEFEFVTLLELISKDSPDEERPNLWVTGWSPDYPDANNWLYDVGLHCEASNDMRAPCTAWDDLVLAAQTEPDLDRRAAMYHQAEEMMFGYEGEFRIAPIFLGAASILVKPWVSAPSDHALFTRWDWVTVDAAQQQAARASS